jgi:hypothetical protein
MRWVAVAVMAMVLLLEGRFRWEDWRARQGFRFVPVALRPGTMEVWAPQGPELVAVNGRPVVGTSGYWRELRRYEELAEKSGPFVLSLRRADGTVVERQPIFGNCTCGKMTDWKALWYAMLPPVVMILVGLAGVLLWPGRGAVWVLLALALGAAQMALVPDGISTFRETAEPRDWDDWMRVPMLVYQSFFAASWPGWALRLAGVRWLGVLPWLGLGVLRMAMAVGWAENARATAWLWEWQGHWSTELTLGAMLISVLCLTGWRLWAGMALGGLMLGLFYWPAEAGWTFALVSYSGGYSQFEPAVPMLYRVPPLLIAGFVAAVCLLGRRGWTVALLCAPMFAVAVMEVRWLWWDPFVLDAVIIAGYVGLAVSAVRLRAADAR